MKTVSFQGVQLTAGQKLRLQQQQHMRSFMNPVLSDQVSTTLAVMEVRKEQGAQPWVNPNKFNICERSSSGTLSMAEWMGY